MSCDIESDTHDAEQEALLSTYVSHPLRSPKRYLPATAMIALALVAFFMSYHRPAGPSKVNSSAADKYGPTSMVQNYYDAVREELKNFSKKMEHCVHEDVNVCHMLEAAGAACGLVSIDVSLEGGPVGGALSAACGLLEVASLLLFQENANDNAAEVSGNFTVSFLSQAFERMESKFPAWEARAAKIGGLSGSGRGFEDKLQEDITALQDSVETFIFGTDTASKNIFGAQGSELQQRSKKLLKLMSKVAHDLKNINPESMLPRKQMCPYSDDELHLMEQLFGDIRLKDFVKTHISAKSHWTASVRLVSLFANVRAYIFFFRSTCSFIGGSRKDVTKNHISNMKNKFHAYQDVLEDFCPETVRQHNIIHIKLLPAGCLKNRYRNDDWRGSTSDFPRYQRILNFPNNSHISGSIADLPRVARIIEFRENVTLTGHIKHFPSTATAIFLDECVHLYGHVADLPLDVKAVHLPKSKNIEGRLANFPRGMTQLGFTQNTQITGDVAGLPPNAEFINFAQNRKIHGNVKDLPRTARVISFEMNNRITGDVKDLPRYAEELVFKHNTQIYGNVANLPRGTRIADFGSSKDIEGRFFDIPAATNIMNFATAKHLVYPEGFKIKWDNNVTWFLAKPGDSCDEACETIGTSCDHNWGVFGAANNGSFTRVVASMNGEEHCSAVGAGNETINPAMHVPTKGCYWHVPSGFGGFHCEVSGILDYRRFCPCKF